MGSALPDLLGAGPTTFDPLGKGFASSNPRGVGSVLPDPLYSASPNPGVCGVGLGQEMGSREGPRLPQPLRTLGVGLGPCP
jgi:hypothetical protein